jgi:hypothetical protein
VIYCLLTAKHSYTWGAFLASWGKPLASRIRLLAYESLKEGRRWDADGAYLFCDLDRVPATFQPRLEALHGFLSNACGSARVLNHPRRSLRRYELLQALHAAGLNRFGVQRVSAAEQPSKFPVVIRPEGNNTAPAQLLADEAAYRAALAGCARANVPLDQLMTVEFCDTADAQGVYRKYGAFIVGASIVPRHVFFSRRWMVRIADLAEPRYLEEERGYLDANPHAEALGRIACIANTSYGRIDYSMLDGQVQTWEINTNPTIASATSAEIPARRDTHMKFLAQFTRALDALERA